MGLFSNLSKSTDLVKGMADRLGTDIADYVARDPERYAERFRAMAVQCTGCTDQTGCQLLQSTCTHLDQAPDYCINKDALEKMRSR